MIKHVTLTGGLGDQLSIIPIAEIYKSIYGIPLTVHSDIADLLEFNPNISISNQVGEIYLQATTDIREPNQIFYGKQLGINMTPMSPVIYLQSEEREWARNIINEPYIVVTTRAGWPSREWDIQRFEVVVDFIHSLGIKVVEVGKKLPNCFGEMSDKCLRNTDVDLVGKTTLRQVAALLSNAICYFGIDTSIFHIAEGVGCRQIMVLKDNDGVDKLYKNIIPIFPKEKCSPQCKEQCVRHECSLQSVSAEQAIEAISHFICESKIDKL